jgi:hypothetical protein
MWASRLQGRRFGKIGLDGAFWLWRESRTQRNRASDTEVEGWSPGVIAGGKTVRACANAPSCAETGTRAHPRYWCLSIR